MRHESPAHDYDEAKFEELLLYFAEQCDEDPWFGAVKLHKLLYFAEFRAYQQLGKAISGVQFQNLEHGPGARRLLPVQNHLLAEGEAKVTVVATPAGVQKRLVALRHPDMSRFTLDERKLIDGVIQEFWGRTGSDVTAISHEEPGWIVTSERETIPYHMALLSRPQPDEHDRKFALEFTQRAQLSSRT